VESCGDPSSSTSQEKSPAPSGRADDPFVYLRPTPQAEVLPNEMSDWLHGVTFQNQSDISSAVSQNPSGSSSAVSQDQSCSLRDHVGTDEGRASQLGMPRSPVALRIEQGSSVGSAAGSDLLGEDPNGLLKKMGVGQTLDDLMSEKIWSKGSARHSQGKCRPCHYFHTPVGCSNGSKCKFCHMPHTGKQRSKLGMAKRLFCKRIAESLKEVKVDDPEAYSRMTELLSARSPYLRSILKDCIDDTAQSGDDRESEQDLGRNAASTEKAVRSNKHIVSL